jgi:hypothetical protein
MLASLPARQEPKNRLTGNRNRSSLNSSRQRLCSEGCQSPAPSVKRIILESAVDSRQRDAENAFAMAFGGGRYLFILFLLLYFVSY